MAVPRRLRFEIFRRDGHACRYCGAMAPDVKLTVDHVIPTALGGSDESSNLVTACADCNSGKASTNPDAVTVEDVAADALRWARALQAAAHNLLADRELLNDMTDRFLAEWKQWTYSVEVRVSPEPPTPTGDLLVDNWWSTVGFSSACHSRPVSFAEGTLTIQVERGYITDTKAELRRSYTRRALSGLVGAEVERIEVADGWPGPLPTPPRATTKRELHSYPLPAGWRDSVERFASLGLPEAEMHRLLRVTMEKRIAGADLFRFFCGCCWRAITNLQEDARRIIETEDGSVAP